MEIFKIISVICLLIRISAAWPYATKTNVTDFINKQVNNSDYQSYTGYINVTSKGSNFFYQLVSAKNADITDNTIPLIVWLQGGPGCSSLFGLYTEIGPFKVQGNGNSTNLVINEYTYALDNHMLFVEQPIGVGFSNILNGEAPNNTNDAAINFEQFMISFFQVYPELATADWYIAGESYAGHYIPSFAARITQNLKTNKLNPLSGVMIGDGLTDAERQTSGYDIYAYCIGLISNKRKQLYRNMENKILQEIMNGVYTNASNDIDFVTGDLVNIAGNVNIYNYRQYQQASGSSNEDYLTAWLNNTDIKAGLGVYPTTSSWISCNETMYSTFGDDISRSFKQNVSYLLDNMRVLLYNGQNDILINTPSSEKWIYSLNWSKTAEFLKTPKANWVVNQTVVGTVKQLNPLTFVFVKKAGHMVPTDQPANALNMVRKWINNDTNWSN